MRQDKYSEYLERKKVQITGELNKQANILHENNLTPEQIVDNINKKTNLIWCREILDDDFLNIRLGLGDVDGKVKVNTTAQEFSLTDENLKKMLKR